MGTTSRWGDAVVVATAANLVRARGLSAEHGTLTGVSRGTAMSDGKPKAPDACGDLEAVNAFARDAHDHLSNSIQLADQKAGYLFATVTAVLAYLHSTGASERWLTALKT